MASSEIVLNVQGRALIPSVSAISVASGDSINISTSDGSPAFLYFSPDASAILSPQPLSPLQLAPSSTTTLTFTSSDPGAYSVFFSSEEIFYPIPFPGSPGSSLILHPIVPPEIQAMPVMASPVGPRTKDGQ